MTVRARNAKVSRRLRPTVQGLESRDLKTVMVAVVPQQAPRPPALVIHGDEGANHVAVSIDKNGTPDDVLDDEIRITVSGPPLGNGIPGFAEFYSFPQYSGDGLGWDPNTYGYEVGSVEAISHIVFGGVGGDDRFENKANVRVIVWGGEGDDELIGGPLADILDGGKDNDIIRGGGGRDEIHGGTGDDLLYGEGGDDTVYGEGGNDTIYLGSGEDYGYGGGLGSQNSDDGNDTIYGGSEADHIYGGPQHDDLYGEGGDDIVYGQGGNDTIYLGFGSDVGYGGDGQDLIHAGSGGDGSADFVDGGPGINTLFVKKKDKFQYGWFVYLIS